MLHERVRDGGRWMICRRSGIMQAFIQYFRVPGTKPYAIYVRVVVVSTSVNNKMDKAHKEG